MPTRLGFTKKSLSVRSELLTDSREFRRICRTFTERSTNDGRVRKKKKLANTGGICANSWELARVRGKRSLATESAHINIIPQQEIMKLLLQ